MSQIKNGWQPDLPLTLSQQTQDLISILYVSNFLKYSFSLIFVFEKRLRHDVNERPRYYSDILSMSSMSTLEQNPSEEEINLVDKVLDLFPPKTPE
jgi:hypothetical protein